MFFINSGPSLTQTQILTLKLTSNFTQTQTQTLILTLTNTNKKCADEYSFSYSSLRLSRCEFSPSYRLQPQQNSENSIFLFLSLMQDQLLQLNY